MALYQWLHDGHLDCYSDGRRRVFWEVVTPGAKENLRFIGELDINIQQKDLALAKTATQNPDIGRMVLLFSHKLIGDPLRENSHWKDAHNTKGVDMSLVSAQMGTISDKFE